MKKYTLFFACCFVPLIAAATISAQGFTGPGANPPPSPSGGPGYTPPPPPPPPGGPGSYPPPPPPPGGPGFNPPPPPHGFQGTPGQYGFTGPARTVTIEQAKTFSHHSPVIITGNIVQAIGGDMFIFRDSSGEITLRIGPREWMYFGSTISPQDTIEISGEIHWPRHSWNIPELHARFMKKV
jgi:uncharacterized protein (TIGR00156 family)